MPKNSFPGRLPNIFRNGEKEHVVKNIRTLQLFLLPTRKKPLLMESRKRKKAEPHFDQQSVYQEPGYHDFPDDFSADNYSDHTDMVPLDKDSIMS